MMIVSAFVVLLQLAFVVGIIWVILHFIRKWW